MSEKRHFCQGGGAAPVGSLTRFLGLGSAPPDSACFRDSDSAYVRLSKEGGHKDLLQMDLAPAARPGPVAYSRNTW